MSDVTPEWVSISHFNATPLYQSQSGLQDQDIEQWVSGKVSTKIPKQITLRICCICAPNLSKSSGQHVLTAEAVVGFADVVVFTPKNFKNPFKNGIDMKVKYNKCSFQLKMIKKSHKIYDSHLHLSLSLHQSIGRQRHWRCSNSSSCTCTWARLYQIVGAEFSIHTFFRVLFN